MAKRKAITKSVRFEVFKRDSFKCQYCGAEAPSAVLVVDHINPVSKGGDNSLMNLITACHPCNAGKSDVLLSDDAAIAKQRAMLDDLNERREQLEMMLAWRDGLKSTGQVEIDAICADWETVAVGYSLNDRGVQSAKKLLRKFTLTQILDAITVAGENYIAYGDDGKATEESVGLAWRKVGGICRLSSMPEDRKRLYYIRGICRNRFNWVNERECLELLERAFEAGADIDALANWAKQATGWVQWANEMDAHIKSLESDSDD